MCDRVKNILVFFPSSPCLCGIKQNLLAAFAVNCATIYMNRFHILCDQERALSYLSTTNQLINLRKQRLKLEKQCWSIANQPLPEASDVRKILDALNAAFEAFAKFIVAGCPPELYSKFQQLQANVANIFVKWETKWNMLPFTCVTELREVDNRIYHLVRPS
jgi:hypothetical protein